MREPLGGELIGCGLYDIHAGRAALAVPLSPGQRGVGDRRRRRRRRCAPPRASESFAPGDVVAFPAGEEGAHTFLNRTEELARVAIFSTLNRQTLPVYPDSGKVGAAGHLFRLADAVDYWDGEESAV